MKFIFLLCLLLFPTDSFFIASFQHKRYYIKQQQYGLNFRRNDKYYPYSRYYYEKYLNHMLNSNNSDTTEQEQTPGFYPSFPQIENTTKSRFRYDENKTDELFKKISDERENKTLPTQPPTPGLRIILKGRPEDFFGNDNESPEIPEDILDLFNKQIPQPHSRQNPYIPSENEGKKSSKNFEVLREVPYSFDDVGGYDNIKRELNQCIDILTNFTKYSLYNVRVPKGLILEGPPGNGKTLIAKALAGEANVSFIPVSGSQFQEKYVGVGSSRIRELFKLARENKPCIIFIDEIDALGRKRSGDGESSSSERDSTLNELLIGLDGFKEATGIFLLGATNRADLLDPALLRPGRIDKRIYINNPDIKTRKEVLQIHIDGKPHEDNISIDDLAELTSGLSCSQCENLLNEAMLLAIRDDRTEFNKGDIDVILNRIMVGWQPNEHKFTEDIIDKIAIHELGHAVVGMLSKHHPKMKKVVINLFAPNSPGYTVFEPSVSGINTREALFEHLMILLSGRIAEEVFYGVSVTTGAINDFDEALKLAEKMIIYYGMGKEVLYPSMSETYKEKIDNEISTLIHHAYDSAEFIVRNCRELILEGSIILKNDNIISSDKLKDLIDTKYNEINNLKI